MNRHIVYPGQIPLDTDILNAIQDGYYGNGWLAESVIGTGTAVVGLAVTPTLPASLQVNVAPGAIYSLQTVDSSSYGSLGTDANQFVKQGLSISSQTLTLTPPATVGQSVNYLVQVAFSEVDSEAIILPYYNASDPSVAWSGPNNSGTSQNTVRKDTCVIQLKAGTPAATGSQATPAPDVGFTGLYIVTVAQGQTTVTVGNISLLSTAPYFPTLPGVPSGVQAGSWISADDTGTANALAIAPQPQITAYAKYQRFNVKVANANTGAATINVNGLGAKSIVRPNGTALLAGDLVAGTIVGLIYDGTSFQIASQIQVPTGAYSVFSASGTFVVPAGVTNLKRVRVWGGGGGGGGATASTVISAGSGGGGGGYSEGSFSVTPGASLTVTVGAGGTAGTATGFGGTGGTSSVGALISATGGIGGSPGVDGVAGVSGSGGSGSGGGLNLTGGGGGFGITISPTALGGTGGSSPFGGCSPSPNSGANGSTGIFPGGGANGGSTPVTGARLGGPAAAGLVIIEY